MAPDLWLAGTIGVGLCLYFLFGGADFGGGVWDLLASGPRAARIRASSPSSWFGILRETAEIGLGIGAIFDRMVRVEKLRRVDVRANVLDHDIWRVAPSADCDIAIWKRKALKRRAIRALDHFDAGARREGQCGGVDRFGPSDVGFKRRCDARLASRGAIIEPASVGSTCAGIDAQRGRLAGLQPQQVLSQ